MLKTAVLTVLVAGAAMAHGQASLTATRLADAQAGFSYLNGNSDYSRSRFNGYGIYADLDFRCHFGAEVEYRFISDGDPAPQTNIYERTYQAGARYSRHYGRFQPFAKVLAGRGVFNYRYGAANLAYNIGTIGGGTDIRILRHVNARVDYEYQRWFSFSREGAPGTGNDSLSPSILSGGLAYHF